MTRSTRPNVHATRRTLQQEALESRQLMAADISLVDGILFVEGTAGADQIEISYLNGQKNIQASITNEAGETNRAAFKSSDVREVEVNARGGNDIVRNQTSHYNIIDGGAGNDVLFGGDGWDDIFGGSGNDLIHGGGDWDILEGEAGDDTILGGEGDDEIFGGTGDNKISGGEGKDIVQQDVTSTAVVETETPAVKTAQPVQPSWVPAATQAVEAVSSNWNKIQTAVGSAEKAVTSKNETALVSLEHKDSAKHELFQANWGSSVKMLGASGETKADLDFSDGKASISATGKAYVVDATMSGKMKFEPVNIGGGLQLKSDLEGSQNLLLGAEATAKASVHKNNGAKLEATAAVFQKYTAKGKLNTDLGLTSTSAHGEATASVGADGAAALEANKQGVNVGLKGFAGDKLGVKGGGKVSGLGVDGVMEGWAGVGAEVSGKATFKDGKLKLGGKIGAGLLVGGKVGGEVTIDVDKFVKDGVSVGNYAIKNADKIDSALNEVANETNALAQQVEQAADQVAQDVANTAINAITPVAKPVNTVFSKIKSWF